MNRNGVTPIIIIGIIATILVVGIVGYFALNKSAQRPIQQNPSYQTTSTNTQLAPTNITSTSQSSMITGTVATPTVYDFQANIPFLERKQLFDNARAFIVAHSAPGMQFDLIFSKQVGNWVVFKVFPENIDTDIATLFMEKIGGTWKAQDFGTAFPDLYDRHPELFK